MQILIADDDKVAVNAISEFLIDNGYKTIQTYDGLEAWDKVNSHYIDMIISDIRMPNLDGMQLLKQIKNNNIKIPLVFITAHGDMNIAIEALNFGAYWFLNKPLNMQKLVAVIKNYEKQLYLEQELEDKRKMLFYSQRLAAIQNLSSGVAHEINTQNSIVLGDLFNIKEFWKVLKKRIKVEEDTKAEYAYKEMRNLINSLIKTGKNIRQIILNMQMIAQKRSSKYKNKITIKECISNVLSMMKYKMKSVSLNLELPEKDINIYIDVMLLTQIFTSIINYSLNAVSKTKKPEIYIREEHDIEFVTISISHNGKSLSKSDREKIFTKNYHCKKFDDRDCFDLSLSYDIVKELGGVINCELFQDKGITMKIMLPTMRFIE